MPLHFGQARTSVSNVRRMRVAQSSRGDVARRAPDFRRSQCCTEISASSKFGYRLARATPVGRALSAHLSVIVWIPNRSDRVIRLIRNGDLVREPSVGLAREGCTMELVAEVRAIAGVFAPQESSACKLARLLDKLRTGNTFWRWREKQSLLSTTRRFVHLCNSTTNSLRNSLKR